VQRSARYRAPIRSGQKLAVPPWSELGEQLAANLRWRGEHEFDLLGKSLAQLVEEARDEMRGGQAASGPYIVTGHQPGLVHPGVWVKNFAAAALADSHRGVGVHIVIDADLCRSASIFVPTGTVDSPRLEAVEYDGPGVAVPWEERRIVDERLWQSFPERVAQAVGTLVPERFLDAWWPLAVERGAATGLIGASLAQARQQTEIAWGCSNLELPQSRLCQTSAFRWFVCTLLADLPRFAAAYNASLAEYRRAHHLRNAAHPAPDLAADGAWLEAPLWVWTSDDVRRRPVFARPATGGVLLSDRRGWEQLLPLATPTAAVDALAEWETAGVKLRSRALITTLFTRLALADLFLHGIGGAKYDEVTDAISRRFFGAAPPAFAAISGTLRLPIPHAATDPREPQRLRAEIRELTFHPERRLTSTTLTNGQGVTAATAIAEKRRWLETEKRAQNAAERHRGIVAANAALQPLVAEDRARLEHLLATAVDRNRASRVLDSREFAFGLFPEKQLQDFLLDFSSAAL
jgi:hypothetical protein